MARLHAALAALAAALTLAPLRGADLEYCGNKFCGLGAVCNKDTKCECTLAQPLGDPVFRCHPDTTVSCVLVGDPSIMGFAGSLTFLDFPCKSTLAKFDTPLMGRKRNSDPPNDWSKADPGRDRCRVIVQGNNDVSDKGTYFLKDVQVTASFDVGGSKKLDSLLVHIYADYATYSYAPYPEVVVQKEDKDGCILRSMDTASNIGLSLCYTEEHKIWSFGISMCSGTSVNFRPWEDTTENQPLRPGVAITTEGDNALFSRENRYPITMCDDPFNDADDPYHSVCKKMGIAGKRNCAFHAFLTNSPPEQPHDCRPSIEMYNMCPEEKRVSAINGCGDIVTKYSKCVLRNDREIMTVFYTCIYSVCFNTATCGELQQYVHHDGDAECNSFPRPC